MKIIIDAETDYLEELEEKDIVIKDFRKLKAYQLSLEFIKQCLQVINSLPPCEEYILKDQLRRASQSVSAQICEGNTQLYKKREISFLSIAIGSLCESQCHLDIALINSYITKEKYDEIESIAIEIKKLLVTYIRNLLSSNNSIKS